VLQMRHYFDMSFKDIAEQTDVSINTALGRMRYALINLRKLLKEHNIDSLVDPFSGEGIGNALLSGEFAACQVQRYFQNNNFSAHFMKKYDKKITDTIWPEIKASRRIIKIIQQPWVFNKIAKKIIQSNDYENKLGRIYFDVDKRIQLTKPWMILKYLLR